MIAIAIGVDAVVAFLILTAPHPIGPMPSESPSVLGSLIVAAGLVAHGVGLLWMFRIYRRDPEAHASFFRSRHP